MHPKYLLVYLASLWSASLAVDFIIERRVEYNTSSKQWNTIPDNFTVPDSLCVDDGSSQCISMGGRCIDKCTCECNVSRSTFGLYDNQWKCTENTRVRKYAGCWNRLYTEDETSPLTTLPMRTPLVSYYIPFLAYCSIAYDHCSYLLCNGTWDNLDSELVQKRFVVERKTGRHHYLKYKTGIPSNPSINGRVIRLGIKCWKNDRCVQIKVKGRLNCSVPLTSTSTPTSLSSTKSTSQIPVQTLLQPRPSPSATALTSSTASFSYIVLTSSMSTFQSLTISRMLASPSILLSPSSTSTTPLQSSTTSFTHFPLAPRRESTDNTAGYIGMIAGSTAGVVVMMAVILAIAIVVQKRRERTIRRRKSIFKITELQNLSSPPNNSLYHDVIHAKPEAKSEYNVIDCQESKGPKQDPSSEKALFYNVLKGPSSEGTFEYKEQRGPFSKGDPIYNVLEEPSSDGAPVYNVLEEPYYNGAPAKEGHKHDKVPLYNGAVRDKSGPHLYQDVDLQAKAGCDNHGYNESTYDLVGDVISSEETENVYQQLNPTGQRSSESVYQQLHRNEKH